MKLYQVDAFTSEKFSGNPAGVSIVEEFPSHEEMQNIAMEMNLSETAFIKSIWPNTYKIRFFTPAEEVPICGHATLSCAHILFSKWIISDDEKILFQAQWWDLEVQKNKHWYSMSFPLWDFQKIDDIQIAEETTGINSILEVSDTDKKWKIILIDDIKTLKNLEPNLHSMKGTSYGNIVVTCKWDTKYDYYMRCFVTDCWINEDPVTGSVECVLAFYWWEKLGKSEFTCFQCSQRGWEKKVRLLDERVEISWEAITVFEIEY